MTSTDASTKDEMFLASCEELLKDRYTENDEDFMKVYNAEPSKPPIIESWWVPNNSGRRGGGRFNRRHQPYGRGHGQGHDRSHGQAHGHDRHPRGYDDRSYGHHRSRPTY